MLKPVRSVAGYLMARQQPKRERRAVLGVVVERVIHRDLPSIPAERFTRVGVDVEPRKIAAGDIEPDAVTFLEYVRGIEGADELSKPVPARAAAEWATYPGSSPAKCRR